MIRISMHSRSQRHSCNDQTSLQTGNHRRVASFDFLDAAPAAFPAALPPKRHYRHRRVVSWDIGAKTPTNMTAQDRFDFGIMIARETVHDISPCSPLRHYNDPLKIEYMEDPLQPYPCHKSSMKPHTGNTTNHPLKRVSTPVSTLPSADNLQAPSTTICVKSSTMRQLSTAEQQEQSSSMVDLKTLEDDDADFFKDLFAPNEREEGIDLLVQFDGGHPQECSIFNKDDDMTLYAQDVMPPCACSRVRDEVVDLAGNINRVDLRAGLEPLPPMIEPEPLSLPLPAIYQQQATPPSLISSMVSPLDSGPVSENNFPRKLYRLLDDCESDPACRSIVSWSEDGLSFGVNNKKQFVELILPIYFDQTQYASFRRQLNMYSFVRQGNTTYSNPYFVNGRRDLLDLIRRKSVNPKTKGN